MYVHKEMATSTALQRVRWAGINRFCSNFDAVLLFCQSPHKVLHKYNVIFCNWLHFSHAIMKSEMALT